MIQFEGWPKTQRLSNTTISITEKIDGTNASVIIEALDHPSDTAESLDAVAIVHGPKGLDYAVGAQSRKRIIRPGADNFGFAAWVQANAVELVDLLGPGRHFGEWWGLGIQRGYNMDQKVFSLFNQHRWSGVAQQRDDWATRATNLGMTTVPLLYAGKLDLSVIDETLHLLREIGSAAAMGWGHASQPAEGVVTYFPYLDVRLKSFVENDDVPKGEGS